MTDFLDQAQAAAKGGNFDEAVRLAKLQIEVQPDHSEAWHQLGHFLGDHLGDSTGGLDAFQHAVQISPDGRNFYCLGNHFQFRIHDHKGARASYEKAIEADPGNWRAWDNLGAILTQKFGEHDAARAAHEKAIELHPGFAQAWDNLGLILTQKFGEHEAARAAHEKAVELDPGYAQAWDNLGLILTKKFGEHEAARAAHEKAVELNPGYAQAWDNLGVILTKKFGEHEAARAAHERSIDLDPNRAQTWDNLGVILTNKFGEHQKAREAHEKATRLDPSYASAWDNLGVILTKRFSEHEPARAAHEKSIGLDPDRAQTWDNFGVILTNQFGEHQRAREAHEKAVGLDPAYAPAWDNLGVILTNKFSEYEAARAAHERSIGLDPNRAQAWDNLGALLQLKFAEFQRARECHEKALKLDPHYASAWQNLGALHFNHLGEVAKAAEAFLQATKIRPDYGLPWQSLGILLSSHGEALPEPFTAARCFKRFLLIAMADPTRDVSLIVQSLSRVDCPLSAIRWLDAIPSLVGQIQAFSQLAGIRRDHWPIGAKWFEYSDHLSAGSSLDRIYLLHTLGDPVAAYHESRSYWAEMPQDPARAALAHFMASEVLDVEGAREILASALPSCIVLATDEKGDGLRFFSAALLLQEAGNDALAISCLERCETSEFRYPALWLRWRLLKDSFRDLAGALASEIAREEKRRLDAGEWMLSIPNGAEQIEGEWMNARGVIRRLMLQEHLADAVMAFIDEQGDLLPRITTVERWKSWNLFHERVKQLPGDEISGFKKESWVSSVLAMFSRSGDEVLIRDLAGFLKASPMKSRKDLDKWVKVVRCHMHDSRLDPADPKVSAFLGFLVMKYHHDSDKNRIVTAVASIPGLGLNLMGAGPVVCALFSAALAVWQKVYDPNASFPEFADFEAKFDLVVSHPQLYKEIFGDRA